MLRYVYLIVDSLDLQLKIFTCLSSLCGHLEPSLLSRVGEIKALYS